MSNRLEQSQTTILKPWGLLIALYNLFGRSVGRSVGCTHGTDLHQQCSQAINVLQR